MAKNKTTDMARKLAPFITGMASDVSEDTAIKEIEAVLQALETHKGSADHDDDPHNWTALNKFFQVLGVVGLTPLNQTSDIGSVTNLFAKGYFAELSTLIFKKENVLVMDGTFVITKQSGKFPADVSATDTQIDFGQNLTVGDFLLLRAEGKQEFMRVGTKVSGTKYNVTRNLDGTGADSWPAQSVYFVRGHQGDGWLELTATDDQRFSVFVQGANWNQFTEIGRFGKLDGWQGAGLTGYGIAVGNYASNQYMAYNTNTNEYYVGGKMRAANGNVMLHNQGIDIIGLITKIAFNKSNEENKAFIQLAANQSNPNLTQLSIDATDELMITVGPDINNQSTSFYIGPNNSFVTTNLFTVSGTISASNIKTTPTAGAIPKADATGKLDAGWLPAPTTAGLRNSGMIYVQPNEWATISFNAKDYDTGDFWTGTAEVRISSNGIYSISAYVGMAGSTATLTSIGIFVNTESVPRIQSNASIHSSGTHCTIAGGLKLNTGDKVYLKIYHNHTTAVNTKMNQPPHLHIERIGSGT